jgi:hypothetical protein
MSGSQSISLRPRYLDAKIGVSRATSITGGECTNNTHDREKTDAMIIQASAVLALSAGDACALRIVRGADFWLAGAEGAAGSYSSNAGQRVLTAKLRGALPAIEVE